MGKERHHNKEQDDDPAGCPQGFLLEKPDPEIRQPGTSLGLTDGEGTSVVLLIVMLFAPAAI